MHISLILWILCCKCWHFEGTDIAVRIQLWSKLIDHIDSCNFMIFEGIFLSAEKVDTWCFQRAVILSLFDGDLTLMAVSSRMLDCIDLLSDIMDVLMNLYFYDTLEGRRHITGIYHSDLRCL